MPSPVSVTLRIPSTEPLPRILDLIQQVETAGFDGVGLLDSQLICRDTFVSLALAADRTSRLRLFPAVTNPFGRHDSVLAGAVQSVAELAPGRVACVVGTGYTAASTIGRKPATLAQMRSCITNVRALLAGREVDFNGTAGRLAFADGQDIPVLMAASGPRALELAGEVADGVMLLVGYTPGIVSAALAHIDLGARRSGRRVEDIEVIWAVRTGVGATTEEARRQARPTAVHWGILRPNNWLERAGLSSPSYEIPQAVLDIYPDLSHAPDWDHAITATSFVSDEVVAQLCDALGLIGTPQYCAQRIAEMAGLGVNNLYLMPLQTFVGPHEEIRAFREVVFPALRSAGLR